MGVGARKGLGWGKKSCFSSEGGIGEHSGGGVHTVSIPPPKVLLTPKTLVEEKLIMRVVGLLEWGAGDNDLCIGGESLQKYVNSIVLGKKKKRPPTQV